MKTIKIVALVDEPFINTYETLYYEAKRNKNFDFKFVLIKSYDERMTSSYSNLQSMMKKYKLPYINGYNMEDGKELDIKTLNPDIVLIQTPYDGIKRSKLYSSEYLSLFTKIIHISYGSTIIDYDEIPFKNAKLIESNKFFERCWFSAMENQLIADQFNMYHPHKFKALGYIKLDKFLNYKWNFHFKIKPRPKFKHIIAWKPRWFATPGASNFLTYIDYFQQLTKTDKDVLLLFVSHPLLKQRLITENLYSKKQVDELFSFLENQPNIMILENDNFLDYIYRADIFVGDYCSTITEAALFDIPTIYTPTYSTFSKFGYEFAKQAYIIDTKDKMSECIENLLRGKDVKKKKRRKFIKIASPKPKDKSYARDLLNYIKNHM